MNAPDYQALSPKDPWWTCTFEGAELSTLRECAQWTIDQKIAWLEEGQKLSEIFAEARLKAKSNAAEGSK